MVNEETKPGKQDSSCSAWSTDEPEGPGQGIAYNGNNRYLPGTEFSEKNQSQSIYNHTCEDCTGRRYRTTQSTHKQETVDTLDYRKHDCRAYCCAPPCHEKFEACSCQFPTIDRIEDPCYEKSKSDSKGSPFYVYSGNPCKNVIGQSSASYPNKPVSEG